jgi:hypothetical protein
MVGWLKLKGSKGVNAFVTIRCMNTYVVLSEKIPELAGLSTRLSSSSIASIAARPSV